MYYINQKRLHSALASLQGAENATCVCRQGIEKHMEGRTAKAALSPAQETIMSSSMLSTASVARSARVAAGLRMQVQLAENIELYACRLITVPKGQHQY